MKTFILSIIMTATSILAMAQGHQADEQIINKQMDAFFTSWRNHNFNDMAHYTTDDCDWVNIVGMWWQGRKQMQFAHQAFHNGMFKNTPLTKVSSTIKFVTADVAIMHLVSKVGTFYPPDGVDHGNNKMGEGKDIATIVFVKKGGNWLITAGENVMLDERAAPTNPALKMK